VPVQRASLNFKAKDSWSRNYSIILSENFHNGRFDFEVGLNERESIHFQIANKILMKPITVYDNKG
jgi:hypothetical protein